ncbi:MAG: D-alanine--D-alanine ligase [Phycisphaerae bacterium]|nr:D-alanine--D-alanine ligase [Phycisphaerae bacterium]
MTQDVGGRRLRTLVLMGGPDAEREVSLQSGEQVANALDAASDLEVIRLVVDRPTREDLLAHAPDVVFPVLHGPFGEGGPMQEILESMRVAYVGCRPRAAATAMDKVLTKALASEVGVPTPSARELRVDDGVFEPCDLEPPVVVKPANEGSSVGLSICRTREEFDRACRDLVAKGRRVLCERYIEGRELTVGIVDGEPLPIIEIVPAVEFYDYEAKYTREDTRYVLDPELPAGIADALRRHTKAVWDRIGCRDLARADFLLDRRPTPGVWFLEINTMPGMTTHSLVPKAARHRGQSMTELCAGLVRRAFARSEAGARSAGVGVRS